MNDHLDSSLSFLSMETLAVSNHGIPEHIIDGVLEMSKRFFALSTESKMKVRVLLFFPLLIVGMRATSDRASKDVEFQGVFATP